VTDELRSRLYAAADYLIRLQEADHWEEFSLPVGRSDAWVTAYVGLALAAAGRHGIHADANPAARRAASWLISNRAYPRGWGYNANTGPDADSTAHAITLLRGMGGDVPQGDTDLLLEHWRPEGGFATFQQATAWGTVHPDVTPVAYLALAPRDRMGLHTPLLEYVKGGRTVDGTWPSYWWRSGHYSTYWNLRLLQQLALEDLPPPPDATGHSGAESCLEIAFAIGIAGLRGQAGAMEALVASLLSHQRPDGGWPGGMNLRVTHHECFRPWERAAGALYEDDCGFITTASAVRVLADLADSSPGRISPSS
jgi:squalene cyclase